MRRRARRALLVLATLSLLAVPATAAHAAPVAQRLYAGVERLNGQLALMGQGTSSLGLRRDRAFSELHFRNHDGYTIKVTAFGQTVALDVSRSRTVDGRHGKRVRERVAETTYLAHGTVNSHTIRASFGDRGRIDLHFRSTGRALRSTQRSGCRKPTGASIASVGIYTGELRFEGEGGFTSVEVHRVRGRSIDLRSLLACLLGASPRSAASLPPAQAPLGIELPGLVAERGGAGRSGVPAVPTHPSSGPKSTTLVADRKQPLSRVFFAAQRRGRGRAHFLAVDQASEGSLAVIRLASVRGDAPAFSFDATLSHASVSPPPPFHGNAELRRGPHDAKSWSGTLAASFLGAPHVPLAEPPFGVWLSQGF